MKNSLTKCPVLDYAFQSHWLIGIFNNQPRPKAQPAKLPKGAPHELAINHPVRGFHLTSSSPGDALTSVRLRAG
jgi:hypothetical protein